MRLILFRRLLLQPPVPALSGLFMRRTGRKRRRRLVGVRLVTRSRLLTRRLLLRARQRLSHCRLVLLLRLLPCLIQQMTLLQLVQLLGQVLRRVWALVGLASWLLSWLLRSVDWPLGCEQLGQVVLYDDLRLNGVVHDWILSLTPDVSILTVCYNFMEYPPSIRDVHRIVNR